MDITIHSSFLPHTDPEASIAFYRDLLGFDLRNDVGYGDLRWLTVGPLAQPGINIVLYPPTGDPNVLEEEARTIMQMMEKGTFSSLLLASADLDATFLKLQGADVEIMQEPTDQDWGVRDCALRDPSGNTIRIQQAR